MEIWKLILSAAVSTLIAFVVGMTYAGLRRKIIARAQNRIGPPVYQNFIDVAKLWSKVTNVHHGIMQHLAPLWLIAMSITTLLFIPIIYGSDFFANLSFKGDLILLLYLMVFGPLGMALGSGQTGNPNSAIGVSRGLTLMVGFEIPWIMALVALMIQYKTTSVADLVRIQQESGTWLMLESPFAFLAALMSMPGMFRYSPFDIVGAPSELASGPISEYGGKYLGMMMTAGSIFAFVKLTLIADLFLGGATNFGTLILKTFALYMYPVLWSIVSPRYRTEQAVWYFWKIPTIFGLLALIQAFIFN